MLLSALLLALREIRRNLMRSFLTVLGIVIGVAAVITMVTLGNGATRMVSDQISSLGSNLLMLRPGQRLGPGRDSAGSPNFRKADVEAIRTQVGSLQVVAPTVSRSVTLVAGNNNWSSSINGTTNDYLIAGNWKLAAGREFLDDEERAGKAVCIIGETVRKELFDNRNPLGDEIRVKTFSCQVVGLLASKGQGAMGMDQDDLVLMPLNTVQRRLAGNQDISGMMIALQNGADTPTVMAQIRALLRERRKLAENEADNFNVMDTRQIAETLSGTIRTMTGLLGAFVLLLVGVMATQLDMASKLENEVQKRQIEEQKRMSLEKALAIPLASGRITLNNGRIGISGKLLFELNSDKLEPEGRKLLKSLVLPLRSYLQTRDEMLMVSGFTDDQSIKSRNRQFEDNWELSAQRALTVTRTLIEEGMPSSMLFAAAFGQEQPLVANTNEKARAQNRRVEMAPVPKAANAAARKS